MNGVTFGLLAIALGLYCIGIGSFLLVAPVAEQRVRNAFVFRTGLIPARGLWRALPARNRRLIPRSRLPFERSGVRVVDASDLHFCHLYFSCSYVLAQRSQSSLFHKGKHSRLHHRLMP